MTKRVRPGGGTVVRARERIQGTPSAAILRAREEHKKKLYRREQVLHNLFYEGMKINIECLGNDGGLKSLSRERTGRRKTGERT